MDHAHRHFMARLPVEFGNWHNTLTVCLEFSQVVLAVDIPVHSMTEQ
jgi:hypothetical protein